MAHVFVQHLVNDYQAWRDVFHSAEEFRKASGELSFKLFHVGGDSNNVAGLFEWDSIENAQAFFGSSDLKQKMVEAGVAGEPQFFFMESA